MTFQQWRVYMKIERAVLRGYKRLFGSRILELECEFPHAVQIIIGSNSSGKTSLIRELSPLPSVRTDYDKNGYKELQISHNQHLYTLISDFSNRTSPHSFMVDNVELNVGHTSQVQEELAIQHFGFTPAIRDLVYGKTKLCDMTPVNRKNMFLTLNPMDLSLVVSAFKSAYASFKDSKANVNLLNSRKANLEASMLPKEALEEHKKTKSELEHRSSDLDKLLFSINNQLNIIKTTHKDEIAYYEYCTSRNMDVIPKDEILAQCRSLNQRVIKFTDINRETYTTDHVQAKAYCDQLAQQKVDLTKEISNLSEEINEYEKHLKEVANNTSQHLETEILALNDQLDKYSHLPTNPIPQSKLDEYGTQVAQLEQRLHIWSDMDLKMIKPEEIVQHLDDLALRKLNLSSMVDSMSRMQSEVDNLTNVIKRNVNRVPANCHSTECILLRTFKQRYDEDYNKLQSLTSSLKSAQAEYDTLRTTYDELANKYEPYQKYQVLNKFRSLQDSINRLYPESISEEDLIERLNREPLKLIKRMYDYLAQSKAYYEYQQLSQLRDRKQIELKALLESTTGASKQFLEKQLTSKRILSQTKLKELVQLERELDNAQHKFKHYTDYIHDRQLVQDLRVKFDKGYQALRTMAEIRYWEHACTCLEAEKREVTSRLVKLEAIVSEQEVIKRTYESETLALLEQVESKKKIYERIAYALSPNTGIPHKSMIRYLNAMIDNVNYFIDQLWSFKLQIQKLDINHPLTYQFPIEIDSELAPDINHLSDGQTEIVNFTWCLAILLQLKMLNQIPLYADELGRACDVTHRNKILLFLNSLVDNSLVEQVFLINHYAALQEGFTNSDVICLNQDNLGDLPSTVNQNVKMLKF